MHTVVDRVPIPATTPKWWDCELALSQHSITYKPIFAYILSST